MRLKQPAWLHEFRTHLPPFVHSQEQALRWLSKAHARAEASSRMDASDHPMPADALADLEHGFERRLRRFGCAPDKIGTRRTWLSDFSTMDFENAKVFTLDLNVLGQGMSSRMEEFSRAMSIAVPELMDGRSPPDELIHVSCTGYDAPSFPQRWLSSLPDNPQTRVTHAYHMGCYASIPAVRLAAGSLAAFEPIDETLGARVDILHTEYCTLHLNPANHEPEQLVIQSLFADGALRYTARAKAPQGRSFKVLACREERAPDSTDHMTWVPGDHGMRMTLSRDVPERIAARLEGFLARLFEDAEMDFEAERRDVVFAVHPGGPKIIDRVETLLQARPDQVAQSRKTLFERGNMSSATLPTIWEALLGDPDSAGTGRKIASLAFGPGLTLCGAIFEVEVR